ncbi:hypothetical protein COCCADRAFT_106892 [Bipolaris zeicola 26-R-13]|uniref:Zn(2)-C6 fungal-type domain-containing protein n=1 Tax=Cochliobolus carbonum (strain 26-R-13) TaxID=930089 RepID=W6Y2M6_COCC2|nr:uncharacterized protein COCCADRAFT_106892 [Bipolaris zeicola 26-R-13]EUC29299.1 hypothetical protein COCCADRAFT_106892 [Bipolaris zeicola 26-R-13]
MRSPPRRVVKGRSQPACNPCRRRKSRCKYEPAEHACLMCKAHQTQCVRTLRNGSVQGTWRDDQIEQSSCHPRQSPSQPSMRTRDLGPSAVDANLAAISTSPSLYLGAAPEVAFDADNEDNPHIAAPATAADSHFLQGYLSSIHAAQGERAIRPALPGTASAPVIFMRVKKRPVGLTIDPNPSSAKLQMIVKLLEPHQDALLMVYRTKANACFPILHEDFFSQHSTRSRISPAVLACLYAHAMCYWPSDQQLRKYHRPDGRFIWNLALDALYSELHISPDMSSIISILLNIGGRPTTTMVGNGMLLGSAISLAKCLGLHRNPAPWNITEQEKTFRTNVWYCLVIHDRWTSLTHGTPPHIRQTHHDVPLPKRTSPDEPGRVFEVLASLSTALGNYLEGLYAISEGANIAALARNLLLDLNTWTDMLPGDIRRILVRGSDLTIPGAANLRLCYLALNFFNLRLYLSVEEADIPLGQASSERLLEARRAAEDIVLFVQELSVKQLEDFWLPTTAFVLTSTAAFLLRLAVQVDFPLSESPTQSLSLSLAHDLVNCLRSHKELHGWELGDICLTQYADVVDRLWDQHVPPELDMTLLDSAPFISDPIFFHSIVADQWDPLVWSEGLREE